METPPLTERQTQVMRLDGQFFGAVEIARRLGTSYQNVSGIRKGVWKKTESFRRTQTKTFLQQREVDIRQEWHDLYALRTLIPFLKGIANG